MRLTILFCTLCFMLLTACDSFAEKNSIPVLPLELQYNDHPLVDRIYDVGNSRFIKVEDFFNGLKAYKYILLGEIHDNSHHHEIQRKVMAELATYSTSTSVAFEMIDDAQAAAIGDMNSLDIDELILRLNKSQPGWDYHTYYQDLLSSALDNQFPIFAANIEKNKLQAVMKNDTAVLDDEVRAMMNSIALTEELDSGLRQEIVDAHCGMFGAEAAEPMVRVQRLRDIKMALSLLNSSEDKRILIAGAGHVRQDRGVPYYLASQHSEGSILTLGMIEVQPNATDIGDYKSRWSSAGFPFDYVWLTPAANRPDPCLVFKQG